METFLKLVFLIFKVIILYLLSLKYFLLKKETPAKTAINSDFEALSRAAVPFLITKGRH